MTISGESEPEYIYGEAAIKSIINNGFNNHSIGYGKSFFDKICKKPVTKAIIYDINSEMPASSPSYGNDTTCLHYDHVNSDTSFIEITDGKTFTDSQYIDFDQRFVFLPMTWEFVTNMPASQTPAENFWKKYMLPNSLKSFTLVHGYNDNGSQFSDCKISRTVPIYVFDTHGGSNGYSNKCLSLIGSNTFQNRSILYGKLPFISEDDLGNKFLSKDEYLCDVVQALAMGGVGFAPYEVRCHYKRFYDNGNYSIATGTFDSAGWGDNLRKYDYFEIKSGICYQEPDGYGVLITTKNPSIYNRLTK